MGDVGALFISLLAAAIAFWGVITQRLIARRRATLDLIARSEADGDLIKARRKFIELATAGDGGLAKYAEANQEKSEETRAINLVCNEFELVSIGIQRGILDLELYRRWNRSTVVRYWGHAQPFVAMLRTRTQNTAYFHEFEEMARWLRDDQMPRRSRFWALIF